MELNLIEAEKHYYVGVTFDTSVSEEDLLRLADNYFGNISSFSDLVKQLEKASPDDIDGFLFQGDSLLEPFPSSLIIRPNQPEG